MLSTKSPRSSNMHATMQTRIRLTHFVVAGLSTLSLAAVGCGGSSEADAGTADLLITNAKIYAADGSPGFSESMAIAGNRVLQVGSSAELEKRRGPKTEVIDARGSA